MNPVDESGKGPGPFFKTIVLFGSSIALSCGGTATDHRDDGENQDQEGTGGFVDVDGDGVPDPDPNSGGSGSGGALSGSGGRATGGASNYPPHDPGEYDCPTEQWTCDGETIACNYETDGLLYLPENCTCDATRPSSPEDCEATETFTCLVAGVSVPDFGNVLQAFSCECVPTTGEYCSSTCQEHSTNPIHYPQCFGPELDDDAIDEVLCGCELPILK